MGVRRIAAAVAGSVLVACEQPAWVAREGAAKPDAPATSAQPEQEEVGPFPKSGLFAVATSGQTGPAGIADDPTIWIHPTDPSLSLVIGTNKSSSGGLHVFDLQGTQIQFVAGGRHNNVDLRYGFLLQGQTVDLVSACDRNNDQIDVYVVDPATRLLRAAGTIQAGIDVYGYAMYHSRATGRFYGLVSSDEGVEQWEMVARPDGTVGGVLARTYAGGNLVEGMVADDELGFLYLAEESTGIYKYAAEPGQSTARLATIDVVGSGTQLAADVEGLAIYYRRDGRGYLVASSQGNDRFVVYRREGDNPYLATFALSGVSDTDGIDVTNAALGSLYPQGLFVAQRSDDDFRMARWQDIAGAIGLAVDTAGFDPRGIGDCTSVASVEVSPAAVTLDAGTTVQLQATARDGSGTALPGCGIGWSSSDPAVATVSATGLVRGVAGGFAVVTAALAGASAQVAIAVVVPPNRRPVVEVAPIEGAVAGTPVPLAATFTDDAQDTHTATVAWGDGDVAAAAIDAVNRRVTAAHTYAVAGAYSVVVTVADGRGEQGAGSTTVVVADRPAVALYLALLDGQSAGGIAAANEDILAFDGRTFALWFDGSDVGLSSFAIDAFEVEGPSQILLSFTNAGTVGGVAIDDSDIVRFTATSLGAQTAGTFALYFDASDVGLSSSDEDVDAIDVLPDGRILLSTTGAFSVAGAAGADEDLVAFRPTALGATTSGTFALWFDGGDVGLGSSGENVDAVAGDAAGRVLFSTSGSFSVPGVAGADEDVFVFTPSSTGASTTGAYAAALFFDGSPLGLAANDLAAIALP